MLKKYTSIDNEKRIGSTTDIAEYAGPDAFVFDFPDDFDFNKQYEYRIENGALIHDPPSASAEQRISELKLNLKNTDYIAAKAMDSVLLSQTLNGDTSSLSLIAEEYSYILKQRQSWRDEINDLERRYGLGGNTERG